MSRFLAHGQFGEQDDTDEPREPPTCKRCGATDLEWVDIGMGRWRLYEGMKLHVCKQISADEFPDL